MSEDGEHSPDGRLIGGRYRLVERVGSGPSGTVWRTRDEQGGRYVAVKEPRLTGNRGHTGNPGHTGTPGNTGDPESAERMRAAHRLLHEARAAARVDHPAVVAIHDVLLDDELPWIVMEFVEGESLEAALAGRGPLADAEAARIGLAVLGALHAAHGVGIVHRDLKPANVLLAAENGRVVVTDFGIGGAGRAGGREISAGFVAPECGSGPGAGPASDLWSLGAVLRAAVADARPDGPLAALTEGLLAPEPEGRPTAEEAARVLAEVAGLGLPEWAVEAAPPGSGTDTAVRGSLPQTAVRGFVAEGAVPGPVSEADVQRPVPETAVPRPVPETVPADPSLSAAAPPTPPSPPTPEPRRLTALSALGLLLQKKPERG